MPESKFTWSQFEGPLPPEADLVDQGLEHFNRGAADFGAIHRFACFVRDDEGDVVGGALSRWWGQAYELQQLWVDQENRHQGLGSELLKMVEKHACEKRCQLIYLETFSFQAPDFYTKLGYKVALEFSGFPDGNKKFIMQKTMN